MTTSETSTRGVQFVEVTETRAGQRIDNFLLTLEKGIPKSRIYRALRKGEVRVNKGRIKPTYKIQVGDIIRIPPLRVSEKTKPSFVSDSLKQILLENVLYEDDVMMVINKPSGLAVHAGSEIQMGLIEALRIIKAEENMLELVHRLDRDTSGCLMIAKSREALLNLQQQMQADEMDKRYLTLLKGQLSAHEQIVEQPLLKNNLDAGERMVIVHPDGKKSKTLFINQQIFDHAQLVEVKLFTGRTHQIRVHSAWMGHPVAGDEKYGDREFNKTLKKQGLRRLFLHAWQLGIKHPISHQPLSFTSPLPDDLKKLIEPWQK